MYLVFVILIILICIFLGLIVLIQNPKGGGLNANFSSSSQMMGVQKTGDILEKGTWVLAIALMLFSLAVNVVAKSGPTNNVNLQNQEQIDKASKPTAPVTGSLNLPPVQQPAAPKK